MKWNRMFWLKREVSQIKDEISELTVLSAMAMNGMPCGSSVSSPVELYYNRKAKLEAKLAKAERKVEEEKDRLEAMLESIEDDEVRVIATDRFLFCKTWETIGYENHMDRTTASKMLRKYFGKGEQY